MYYWATFKIKLWTKNITDSKYGKLSAFKLYFTSDGNILKWEDSIRYLGVFIESALHFRCSFDMAKRKFYSAFNAIMGKIGRLASEEVTLSLISAKCIPCLLYATEAMPFNSSKLKSLNFPVKRVLYKLFKTTSSDIINECHYVFNFPDITDLIKKRKLNFSKRLAVTENIICNSFNGMFPLPIDDV